MIGLHVHAHVGEGRVEARTLVHHHCVYAVFFQEAAYHLRFVRGSGAENERPVPHVGSVRCAIRFGHIQGQRRRVRSVTVAARGLLALDEGAHAEDLLQILLEDHFLLQQLGS